MQKKQTSLKKNVVQSFIYLQNILLEIWRKPHVKKTSNKLKRINDRIIKSHKKLYNVTKSYEKLWTVIKSYQKLS